MTKLEFLKKLKKGLSHLPRKDVNERLSFYGEMIDDLIEEGLSEEEAVLKIASIDEIVADTPIPTAKPPKKLNGHVIALLVLGFPLWLPLLIAALAVIFSLYVSAWAVIISLWSVFVSLIGCALGGLVSGVAFFCQGKAFSGVAMIGVSLVCAGLSILLFFGCRWVTRGFVALTKRIFKRKKEVA